MKFIKGESTKKIVLEDFSEESSFHVLLKYLKNEKEVGGEVPMSAYSIVRRIVQGLTEIQFS